MIPTLLACAVLFFVPVLFVWNSVYQDGVVGRLALIGISFSALVFGLKLLTGRYNQTQPETEILVVSFAVFLVWHLWRFHRRVLTEKKARDGKVERRAHAGG